MTDSKGPSIVVRLTKSGVAIASPGGEFVELRLTDSGVMFGNSKAGDDQFVELRLTNEGVVVRDPKSQKEYQELKFSTNGILLGAPGNVE